MTSSVIRSLAIASFLFALVPACGGGGLPSDVDAGADLSASHDLSVSGDLSGPQPHDLSGIDFSGVACGTMTCGAGSICCITPDFQNNTATAMCQTGSSCGDGGVPAACDGPEDCQMSVPNCCVDIALGNMTVGGGASCTASCPATVTQNPTAIKTRVCHGAADCTNYSGTAPIIGNAAFDRCCAYPGLPLKFCAPGIITLASSSITCD